MPKYNALPNPVRITLGVVPRQSWRTGFGERRTSRKAWVRDVAFDCWTRVFRRSAGWRRKALTTPDPRPAAKWKAVVDVVLLALFVRISVIEVGIELTSRRLALLCSMGHCRSNQQIIIFQYYLEALCEGALSSETHGVLEGKSRVGRNRVSMRSWIESAAVVSRANSERHSFSLR
jgi:hypothetical protein